VDEVRRRTDHELCGFVEQRAGQWSALTVFGALLGQHDSRADAVEHVLDDGLDSLADRWTLRPRQGDEEVVCIQEANPDSVTVTRGYYSLPGVPTLTITAAQLAAGEWELHR
jgi:hypothetical protein